MDDIKDLSLEEILNLDMVYLDFSFKTYKLLQGSRIETVRDVLTSPLSMFADIRGFEDKNMEELKERIAALNIPGFHLEMADDEINDLLLSSALAALVGDEKGELKHIELFATQMQDETAKMEYVVSMARKYHNGSLDAIQRKKRLLEELKNIYEEQAYLNEENISLDLQIAALMSKLGATVNYNAYSELKEYVKSKRV